MNILFGGMFSSTTEFQNQLFTNFGSQKKTSSNFCTLLSGFKTRRISARLLTSLVVGSVVVRQTRLSNIIGAMEPRDVFLPLQQSQLFMLLGIYCQGRVLVPHNRSLETDIPSFVLSKNINSVCIHVSPGPKQPHIQSCFFFNERQIKKHPVIGGLGILH